MAASQKRQRSAANANGHNETGHTNDHGKQVKVGRSVNRLRLLIEQLPGGRKRLHLKGIDTIAIPSELYELTDLDVLDVTPESKSGMGYTLSRLPIEFCSLTNLKILHLDNNNIVSFPNQIGQLHNLEILTASHNHLTTLPDQMRKLNSLQSCHLANNQIEEMPLCLCYLSSSLLFLDLSYNQLRQLPASIQHLKQLRTFLLLGNKLKTLPDSICFLSKLETLWLGDNKLLELPKNFGQLKQLDWNYHGELSSNFEGNPLQNPPLSVCRKGMNAIEQYLKKN